MSKILTLFLVLAALPTVNASWFWFDDDDDEVAEAPRVSELMAPASELIDAASDLAADDKISEAIEKYREALAKLDEIEKANPERVKTPEFATLRTKRAYVNAAIDTLLLNQGLDNARPVGVSDTTELEKKLAEEKAKVVKEKSEGESKKDEAMPDEAVKALKAKDYEVLNDLISAMLEKNPKDLKALLLKAGAATAQGEYREAELTLKRAITEHPESYFPHYNLARLILLANPENREGAAREYQTGRDLGGPEVKALEDTLK